MDFFFGKVFPYLFTALVVVAVVTFLYSGCYVISSMANEKRCLEMGYPKQVLTWDLEGYCMNLDGSVTVSVVKANDTVFP